MSRASPANRADSIKNSGELKLNGIAVLSNVKACLKSKDFRGISKPGQPGSYEQPLNATKIYNL